MRLSSAALVVAGASIGFPRDSCSIDPGPVGGSSAGRPRVSADPVTALQLALFGLGYPASIAVITRFVPVVRQRRWGWLAVHHVGVGAVIVAWATRREGVAVAANATWLVASSAWYALGRRS